jgi:hypothetical protein
MLPFTFPLFLAVVITLYVIIVFEINVHQAALPESEAYTEIGQWGPYVVAALVLTATLVAKSKDWNFDNFQNRGFEWLLGRDKSRRMNRDSSEVRLGQSVSDPFIPLSDLGGVGEPFRLSVLGDDEERIHRSSLIP